jgi:glucose/arabinose dehydrogenase
MPIPRLAPSLAVLALLAASSAPAFAQATPEQPQAPAAGAAAPPAQPQAPAAGGAPTPPPSWQQGRPPAATESMTKLAPVAGPPVAAPAEKLPVDKLKVPAGFKVEVYASGLANARSMARGSDGTIFVGSRLVGRVYAITDKDGQRTVKTIAEKLHRPNGVAFKDGALYVAELSRVLRYDDIETKLDSPPEPKVIYEDLPKDEPHGWKFIGIGPDNKLYVPIGAPCNICEPPATHAQIRRINLDGSGAEVVARGVRNTVGFDWQPGTGQLWFTDNGRDWMSESVPHDELNRVSKPGEEHFGFPFCHQGDLLDSEQGWGKTCAEATPPAAKMGPHSAALGMRFYNGAMFPAEYKGAIFVARHGSWNKTRRVGGDIQAVKLNADGSVAKVEDFLTGFLQDNVYVGRPVDLLVMPDGSLLVSDDYNGAIYRISYAG